MSSDAVAVLDTWTAQLHDPCGERLDGYVVVDGIAGDYARVQFVPADPTARDGFTAFLKQESGGWKQLTGGTAFDQQNARPAGHPGRAARRARRVGDLRLPRDDGRQGDRPACRRRVGVFRMFRKRSDASM